MRNATRTIMATVSLALGACDQLMPGGPNGPDGGDPAESPCSTATLFAGSPTYAGAGTPDPAGAGLLAEPPLQWRHLVFDGDRLYTHVGEELWLADLSAAAPMVRRFAGAAQDGNAAFTAGACADARFGNTHGLALVPGGALVVADFNANALVEVIDPAGDGCRVEYRAGTSEPVASLDPFSPPNQGDVDGPGVDARLSGPKWPVADAQGNVYFVDEGAQKVKKLARDAGHTVTTVTSLAGEAAADWLGMTLLDGRLYLVGNSSIEGFVLEVDPYTGARRTVVGGGGSLFPPLESSSSPALTSIASDGEGLWVSGAGYVWTVAVDGAVAWAAGTGIVSELPAGYDPAAEHAVGELVLDYAIGDQTTASTSTFMSFRSGDLYWRGRADDVYVQQIACR